MRGTRTRRTGDALFGSAGWLFADLMLAVVVMLFLGAVLSAQEEPESKPAARTSTATTTTTTTPPTTTTPVPPPGLLPEPIKLDLFVNTEALRSGDPGAIQAMRGDVGAALAGPLAGRRVGVVLTFGSGSISNVSRATAVARLFNDHVLRALGGQFAGAAYSGFFQQDADLSKVSVWLFVFAP